MVRGRGGSTARSAVPTSCPSLVKGKLFIPIAGLASASHAERVRYVCMLGYVLLLVPVVVLFCQSHHHDVFWAATRPMVIRLCLALAGLTWVAIGGTSRGALWAAGGATTTSHLHDSPAMTMERLRRALRGHLPACLALVALLKVWDGGDGFLRDREDFDHTPWMFIAITCGAIVVDARASMGAGLPFTEGAVRVVGWMAVMAGAAVGSQRQQQLGWVWWCMGVAFSAFVAGWYLVVARVEGKEREAERTALDVAAWCEEHPP